jgi:Tol biopolymer transport system component
MLKVADIVIVSTLVILGGCGVQTTGPSPGAWRWIFGTGGAALSSLDETGKTHLFMRCQTGSIGINWPATTVDSSALFIVSQAGQEYEIHEISWTGEERRRLYSSREMPTFLAVSEDKGRLAFIEGHDLVVLSLGRSAGAATLVTGTAGYGPSWCPEGLRLVFETTEKEVCVSSMSGEVTIVATQAGRPAWHPQLQKILFWRGREFILFDLDTREESVVAHTKQAFDSAGSWMSPTWCPDGRYFVYYEAVSTWPRDSARVYLVDTETRKQLLITKKVTCPIGGLAWLRGDVRSGDGY